MSTSCLECAHLAPIKRIPEGDPREIQVGQQGYLARGLALCRICLPGKSPRFRYIQGSSTCPDFEPIKDADRVANRKALAERLQRDFAAWMRGLKEKRK